jgi:hypothetical protein
LWTKTTDRAQRLLAFVPSMGGFDRLWLKGVGIMYAFVSEASRKAKAVRQLYESLKNNSRGERLPGMMIGGYEAREGVRVSQGDKQRVLNLKLHDEHLSPYFKSDMNLFHLLMLDETSDIWIYRCDNGWIFVFEGVQAAPRPFGPQGYDLR